MVIHYMIKMESHASGENRLINKVLDNSVAMWKNKVKYAIPTSHQGKLHMEQRFKYFFNEVVKVAREDMGELCCKVILSVTQNPESTCDKVDFHVHFGF